MIKIPDESLVCFDDFWEEVTQSHHYNGGFSMAEAINGKVQSSDGASVPVASAEYRGHYWLVEGGAGVADILLVCVKDESDFYSWVTITAGLPL
jgi:hypothetical protein